VLVLALVLSGMVATAEAIAGATTGTADLPPGPAAAAPAAAAPASAAADAAATPAAVVVNHREVVRFAQPLLGRSAAERAAIAQATLAAVLARDGPGTVSLVWADGETAALQLDGTILFYLRSSDLPPGSDATLAQQAEAVRARLQQAVAEVREAGDLRRIGRGVALSAAATALAGGLWWLCLRLRRRLLTRLTDAAAAGGAPVPATPMGQALLGTMAQHARGLAQTTVRVASGLLLLVLADLWVTFVLRQFAATRPWGERATDWLLDLLARFALAIAGAIPGLLTAALIVLLARLAARAASAVLARIESGELVVGWLDRDTAGPTRRVGLVVIWLFALAMAYPFLPGANSEAFKGVSVLAGLMLSLGASGVVGNVVSGLSLMYSRTLRPGEYVKIGDTEGTVTVVGLFATKLHTGLGEEVSLPNAVVFGQPVRNFSRLVQDGQFMLQVVVTIGYATPWRQVQAMLLEAARRTPGVSPTPAPYVVQSALKHSQDELYDSLVAHIRTHIATVKSSPYGKRILARSNLLGKPLTTR
jgi:small-conductance mechanosensitive channel